MKNIVSIIVASYNAEKYILETLDSCINQSYKNIEIIIADDCSQDSSVSLIETWCEEKKLTHPLIECILVTSSKNNGIPKNLNNALKYAKGRWIKCIGSDDLLLEDAIYEFIQRISKYDEQDKIGAVFTNFETFGLNVSTPTRYPLSWTKNISGMKPSCLKKYLAAIHFNNVAPGAFINRRFLDSFDESYRLLEDLPLWMKLIHNNVPTLFFSYVSVKYRLHSTQVTSPASPVRKILENDLRRLNELKYINKNYIGYYHNKFNIYCSSKGTSFYRYLKILNPFNIIIKCYEKVIK